MTTTTKPKTTRPKQPKQKLQAFLGELREQQDKQPAPRILYDIQNERIVYL